MSQKGQKLPNIVGNFIKKRREAAGLSQRALGQLFTPTVTTQFISNVERGVTPLPPSHMATLSGALRIPEEELREVMEREYAARLNGRSNGLNGSAVHQAQVRVASGDFEFINQLYNAYKAASSENKQAFLNVCNSILKLPPSDSSGSSASGGGGGTPPA